MARPRAETITKEPHSVSLKVLRLSRPSLAQQHPLPYNIIPDGSNLPNIPSSASVAYPHSTDHSFILSPNLSLPPSFGSAYVGETFSCSLCANNEILSTSTGHPPRTVSQIRLLAEMQTPSTGIPLTLHPEDGNAKPATASTPGSSIQRIIHFDLKEEGTHVLAVNISYVETVTSAPALNPGPSSPPSPSTAAPPAPQSRARSFRKLYQFAASPLLSVRTKATELPPLEIPDKSLGPYGRTSLLQYALEAQLENVSDDTVVLERAELKAKKPFGGVSLNWDATTITTTDTTNVPGSSHGNDIAIEKVVEGESQPANTDATATVTATTTNNNNPILNPRDVLQLLYHITQQPNTTEGVDELKANLKRDGRTVLGQLSISWRGSMGAKGSLSTGGLMTRRR